MRKLFVVFAVLIIAVFGAGCSSSPDIGTGSSSNGLPDIVRNARRNAPEGVLVGIGSAKLASQNQSRTVAETRARAEIARAMDSMVQDMIRDYTASSEADIDSVLAFQESITVTLSKTNIQGAVIADEDFIDGTYYIVMYLSKADVVREINQAQAAARLAVPAMASFDAESRMNAAFDRQSAAEIRVADTD